MLDDVLFLLIIVGMALSLAYMRAELLDARGRKRGDRQGRG